MSEVGSLLNLQRQIEEITRREIIATKVECELDCTSNDVVLSGNRAALLHIASRIVKLVGSGVSGSHFTIDKSDIAPDATATLTVALKMRQ